MKSMLTPFQRVSWYRRRLSLLFEKKTWACHCSKAIQGAKQSQHQLETSGCQWLYPFSQADYLKDKREPTFLFSTLLFLWKENNLWQHQEELSLPGCTKLKKNLILSWCLLQLLPTEGLSLWDQLTLQLHTKEYKCFSLRSFSTSLLNNVLGGPLLAFISHRSCARNASMSYFEGLTAKFTVHLLHLGEPCSTDNKPHKCISLLRSFLLSCHLMVSWSPKELRSLFSWQNSRLLQCSFLYSSSKALSNPLFLPKIGTDITSGYLCITVAGNSVI